MNAVLEKRENNKVTFNFEISQDQFKDAVQKAYIKNKSRINIPGFRKGKVPKKVIEMTYGKDVFYEEALNLILPTEYDNAVKELEIDPVDAPKVDIGELEDGQPIKVTVEVDVVPEVELGDYKNIEIEDIEYIVTDEVLEAELKSVQEMNGRIVQVEGRETKDGDVVTIDFKGFVDGEEFEGGAAEGHELELGSNTFIPGFEEQLIGKKKEEEVEVKVTFPEDYFQEDLKGKEAKFEVTIQEIKEKELPALDDEFAKDVSEFDTLDEYKESIKERLEKEYKNKEKLERENAIIEKVVEIAKVDIPEGMIEEQIQTELKEFDYRLRPQGLDLEQYLEMTNSNVDGLKAQMRPIASKRVRADLVLNAIAEKEAIEVKEEDIDIELEKIAKNNKQKDTKKFIADMKKRDLDYLKKGIINNKVMEILKSNTKFK